jgi:hypothetical protein
MKWPAKYPVKGGRGRWGSWLRARVLRGKRAGFVDAGRVYFLQENAMLTYNMERILRSIGGRTGCVQGALVETVTIASDSGTTPEAINDELRALCGLGYLVEGADQVRFALSPRGAAWCQR